VGFRDTNIIKIQFEEGHELHGLVARAHGLSMDEYVTAVGLDGGDGYDTAEGVKRFYDALVEWNLEDTDGKPVPVNAAHTRSNRIIAALTTAWIEAVSSGVHSNDPLPESSPSGEPSLEASIPMETLSPSLAS
jgi:hypothetical protein